ncbi:MAG: PAS domain-containing protein [Candidatus Kapabacteria bacterium]|nr:PAS domain-containing protein [Candidatus Kapabacteria bacterium]
MKTIIIGGGKGCKSILDLTKGAFLKELKLEILAVVDINDNAPGMIYARELGIKTIVDLNEALSIPDLELIIELTGNDKFLQELYRNLKPGIKIIDHTFAHIFWDLVNAQEEIINQINELNKLQKTLKKEQHFLQNIFDSDYDLNVVIDLNKNIIRSNKQFLDFVDKDESEIIGTNYIDLLKNLDFDIDISETEKNINLVIENRKPITTIRFLRKPVESHWEIARIPIIDENENIYSILIKWHRITEKVMLMRQIEQQEIRFKSFINTAQDWISIKDKEGKYVIVNPVTASAFGLKTEDFIGKKPEEILPEKIASLVKKHDEEVIKLRQHKQYDEKMIIQGQERHFKMTRFPLIDQNNEIIGTCTIGRDITNEVLLQEQLIQNEKLAALGKLAAGVAHEINNPLTGILAYAEDLLDSVPDSKDLKEDIKVIIRETLRCRDIVRNLLDFARQDKPVFQIIDPNQIINQTLSLITRLPQFRDIKITTLLYDKIPKIESDPKQLQQVLLNLMINAADAMKNKGNLTISTDYFKNKKMCCISVEDDGPGVPENLIDKIFEPFFSTKNTNGLGLAVSWGIIERHHGTIEVDTADSGGAIFRILLPASNRLN